MRRRALVLAAAVTVSMAAGNTAFAHGGGGGRHGHGGGHRPPEHQPPSGGGHGHSGHRNASIAFTLTGRQVPGGGDPTGRAQAWLRLEPEPQLVCLRSTWRDLAGEVTAIHLHRGAEGETGPHHIDLLDKASLDGAENRVEFCVKVTDGTGGDDQPVHAHHAGHDHGSPGASGGPATQSPSSASAADRIQEVVDNPDGFYLNVHTTAYPQGAVRGQLG